MRFTKGVSGLLPCALGLLVYVVFAADVIDGPRYAEVLSVDEANDDGIEIIDMSMAVFHQLDENGDGILDTSELGVRFSI